jgi:hypothetical protein
MRVSYSRDCLGCSQSVVGGFLVSRFSLRASRLGRLGGRELLVLVHVHGWLKIGWDFPGSAVGRRGCPWCLAVRGPTQLVVGQRPSSGASMDVHHWKTGPIRCTIRSMMPDVCRSGWAALD